MAYINRGLPAYGPTGFAYSTPYHRAGQSLDLTFHLAVSREILGRLADGRSSSTRASAGMASRKPDAGDGGVMGRVLAPHHVTEFSTNGQCS
jgi:hypothetical protein